MNKRMRTAAAVICLAATQVWALHDPTIGDPPVESRVETQGHFRLFYDFGETEVMAEYVTRYEPDRQASYNGFALGSYLRLHRNLKIGAFYRLQFGARHDEDWIESGSDWVWADTSNRLEHVLMLDVTPRFLLEFIPGRDWVLAVKNRYEATIVGDSQAILHSLLVRPGLTYFWMVDREPVVNVSLAYATYWSLNFGDKPWYSHGPYLTVLYHLNELVKIDVSAGTQWVFWSDSDDFHRLWPDDDYSTSIYRPVIVDIGVILSLER